MYIQVLLFTILFEIYAMLDFREVILQSVHTIFTRVMEVDQYQMCS